MALINRQQIASLHGCKITWRFKADDLAKVDPNPLVITTYSYDTLMFRDGSMRSAAESSGDWPAARLAYELKRHGTSFRRVALSAGYAPSSLWNVTRISWPKAERLIAHTLGLRVADIWPDRVEARRIRRRNRSGRK